jgi:uncharacterized protein (DUF1778 family)
MARTAELKHERLHLRLDTKIKHKLERAAAYEGTNISDFVLVNMANLADRVIESHERVTLSPVDWDAFQKALLHPPKPNVALKSAIRRYRNLTK